MNEKHGIWFTKPDPTILNQSGRQTANEHAGIEITESGIDFLKGRLMVDERTRQPAGVLHGGISVLLAETLASWGAAYSVDSTKFYCVGQEINANHLRAVNSGWIYGTAKPLHLGRKSHVWEIHIRDEHEQLVCVARMTIAVLEVPSKYK